MLVEDLRIGSDEDSVGANRFEDLSKPTCYFVICCGRVQECCLTA